ncbi:MAG: hypothetical protein E7267_06250 [Lachnospiraceae bacterium]|nr:hypothetical protein [Lachnospiraceae bacterium]
MIDKSILLKTIMLIFTSVIVIGNTASAKNADFTKTKTTINYSENNEGLYFDNENKLSFYQCVDDGRDEQHGYYMNLYKYRCDNGAIEKLQTIPIYEGDVRYAEEIGDAGDTIVVRTLKNRFVDFTVIDKDGKEVSNIVDKISYKKSDALSITDIYIKGKKLYYTYIINRSKVHIRCVHLKNEKFISDKILKSKGIVDEVIIFDNRVYMIADKDIKSYTLQGKKEISYKLPKVKKYIRISQNEKMPLREGMSISGKYIYYTNGKDGIYRCKINNEKNGFSLYYNTKKDSDFKESKFFDFCVKDKNSFYVRFIEREEDYGDPTVLVEFSSKKKSWEENSATNNSDDKSLSWINAKITEKDDTTT